MENQKIEIKKTLPQLVEKKSSFRLTVERSLEKQIRFLCDKLPHNEFSGTLFYTVTGTFEDNNLHIHAKDFYLQDIGSGAFTEFKNDASLVTYMIEHDLLDCYMGLIH